MDHSNPTIQPWVAIVSWVGSVPDNCVVALEMGDEAAFDQMRIHTPRCTVTHRLDRINVKVGDCLQSGSSIRHIILYIPIWSPVT